MKKMMTALTMPPTTGAESMDTGQVQMVKQPSKLAVPVEVETRNFSHWTAKKRADDWTLIEPRR